MKLFFLRHGLAGDPTEWPANDADRPLTDYGKERMGREAATIARLDLGLDAILTSPLVRAYQTAEIVARELDLLDALKSDERLAPGFDREELAGILRDHAEAGAVMLVGHEPDFSGTIGSLIGGARVVCKKGSLAYVELPDPSSSEGTLVWLIPPKVLAGR
jgi:phosphohistidine phosphatase